LQVETRQAIDHIEAIAAVDGVDGIFIGTGGPARLAWLRGRDCQPEVMPLIDEAIRRIDKCGCAPGLLTPERARRPAAASAAAPSFVRGGAAISASWRAAAEALAATFNHGSAVRGTYDVAQDPDAADLDRRVPARMKTGGLRTDADSRRVS